VSPACASSAAPSLRRILLKLSGEALMGKQPYGIDMSMLQRIAGEIRELSDMGVETAVVVGGGNIFRGEGLARAGMDRVTADHMGMLATVINALALQDALERLGTGVRVMSSMAVRSVCEDYIRRRALRHLEKGRICVFAAGTGNPYLSTDTAASLRAIEIGAELLIKGTKVDGVYSADPNLEPDAKRYERISHEELIGGRLGVMDSTAAVMCRDNDLPIRVYDVASSGDLLRIVRGENIGTLVSSETP